jgi:hypothetical protein
MSVEQKLQIATKALEAIAKDATWAPFVAKHALERLATANKEPNK